MAPASLFDLSLNCAASHPELLTDVEGLPDEVASLLFDLILAKGKLSPRILKIFEKAQHDSVLHRVKQLGISSWTPPLVQDSKTFPGQKPRLW